MNTINTKWSWINPKWCIPFEPFHHIKIKIKSIYLSSRTWGVVAPSPEPEAHVWNVRAFRIELEFRSVGFWVEGKTEVSGENPLRAESNNKLKPRMTPIRGGGGTWPMFGYRGAAEGLKSWPCLGQGYAKNPTLCRTTASISRTCLGQVTKCTLSGLHEFKLFNKSFKSEKSCSMRLKASYILMIL